MRVYLFLFISISFSSLLTAQSTVKGTVTDQTDGFTLVGVGVREKGTNNGTLTDLDGNYEIQVSSPTSILLFSYVGKQDREEIVGERSRIDVVLGGASELEAVVVTGYRGGVEVKDLVGSYAAVQEEELVADRPVESLDQLLEGRVAGVQVQTVTGEPGLPIRVQIRGQGSLPSAGSGISASTQPLFVLDGVPLFDVLETNNTGTFFSDFNNQPLNPLALINADDIASITILKDASATALYGADAANGVVLITTKKGQEGKQTISLSANYGMGRTINEIKFLNTEQYVELARETLFNSGLNPNLAGPSNIETDWRSLVQQNPVNADLDLAISGGRAGITYRLTAGYSDIESVHIGNGLRQANVNLSLQIPLSNRFKLSTRFSGATQRKDGLRSFDVFSFLPNLPVRLEDGSFNNDGFFVNLPNPMALLEQNENYQNTFSTNAQVTLEYQPINPIKLRLLAGFDQQARNQFQYDSALNGSGARRGGRLRLTDANNQQWITNGQAIWAPETGTNHHINVLLGGELQRQETFTVVSIGNGFPFDDLRRLSALPSNQQETRESTFERAKA
ncbi:MAG: TonB-dependent receptor plug domain-containing protein, partial [Bacteroidota bacterium]